jgi:TetR/AcrR family transcriptional regulator, regulator of cefoperazone and chloramphenicol sensitivity
MPPPAALAHAGRSSSEAPQRLLFEAARIFAEKGFDAASTREICLAAGANVAAIHYHYGDKAGLYRAVLRASIERVVTEFPVPAPHGVPPLAESMRDFLRAFLVPMCGDETSQWFSRIHLRETLEPTPMMQDVIGEFVLPHFRNLVAVLAQHCGVIEPDDELHRLAFAITALINDYCLSQHWMKVLAPGLLNRDDAMARTLDSLTGYACALVEHEARRRHGGTGLPTPTRVPPV